MRLSIIVPVYNTPIEKLKRCFDSIIAIKNKSYECVIVDDGSNEECAAYLKQLADNISEGIYIPKTNGGVSSARNVGIERAEGEYICFADADDEIAPEVFEQFLSRSNDDYIVFTDMIFINKNKREICKVCNNREITYEKILYRVFEDADLNGPVCKFIKKSFIEQKKIRFREDMVTAEDRVFLLDMLIQKPTMSYIDKVGYFYYREEASGRNRLQKYRDRFYLNYEEVYLKELACISHSDLSLPKQDFLKKCADKLFISDVFNATLELTEIGIQLQEMEPEIINAANFVDTDKIDRKTAIRRKLLLKKHWKTLKILAFFRRKYLRAKGLI